MARLLFPGMSFFMKQCFQAKSSASDILNLFHDRVFPMPFFDSDESNNVQFATQSNTDFSTPEVV